MSCSSRILECYYKIDKKLPARSHKIDIHDTIECAGSTLDFGTGKIVNVYFLITRVLFALYALTVTIWSMYRFFSKGYFFIWWVYMTHWGLLINTTYLWSSVLIHYKVYRSVKDKADCTLNDFASLEELGIHGLWHWTLYWLNTGLAVAIFIVLLFWGLVHDYDSDEPIKAITVNTHGGIAIVIVLDWMGSTWQLSYWGAITTFFTPLLWVFVSVVFYLSGATNEYDDERYIYSVINWGESPLSSFGYSVVVVTVVPLFHLGFVALKNAIMECWVKSRSDEEQKILVLVHHENESIAVAMEVRNTEPV